MSSGAAADPRQRIFIFGAFQALDRAKGDYINVTYRNDIVDVDVGVDGGWMFKVIPDLSAIVTVALQAQSPTNLQYSLQMQQIAKGFITAKPLMVLEVNGQTVLSAARALPVKYADLIWNDGTEVRSWSFITGRLEGLVGGIAPSIITP